MKSSELVKFLNNHYRRVFQLFFFSLTVYAWVRLYLFVSHFDKGTPYIERPTSIEAFLPIGALVSLKNLIVNRFIDPIHPAALVIFMAILISAVILRRGFCGWVCPVGFVSEIVSMAGQKISGKSLKGIRHFKITKYILLGFFLALVLPMSSEELVAFIFSPYWAIADVKLLDFWLKPGTITVVVTLLLFVGTLAIRNLWCRYLCPYGALLGIVSYLSPAKIKKKTCTGCLKCDDVCPSYIEVSKADKIDSPDCIMCLECISACKYNHLELEFAEFKMKKHYYPLIIAGILFGFFAIAKITGHWDSILSYEDYMRLLSVRHMISH